MWSLQSSSACLTENAPVKQSPAPTVSTILKSLKTSSFDEAGHFTCKSLAIILDPLLPSFKSTFKFGYLESNLVLT